MNRKETVVEFVKRFCAGDDDGMEGLLATDLIFSGPFLQSDSRDDYLSVLRNDPPEPRPYRLLNVFENDEEVAVFYEFTVDGESVLIAQLCRFKGDFISEIQMIFDSKAFG